MFSRLFTGYQETARVGKPRICARIKRDAGSKADNPSIRQPNAFRNFYEDVTGYQEATQEGKPKAPSIRPETPAKNIAPMVAQQSASSTSAPSIELHAEGLKVDGLRAICF
jgi:hypothetical protein